MFHWSNNGMLLSFDDYSFKRFSKTWFLPKGSFYATLGALVSEGGPYLNARAPGLLRCAPAERHLGRAVLVRAVQGHEPHAVHRLRRPGPRGHDGRVADHAQHDRGRHLLRHVHRARHRPHPVAGLVPPPVPGEGTQTRGVECHRITPDRGSRVPCFLQISFILKSF